MLAADQYIVLHGVPALRARHLADATQNASRGESKKDRSPSPTIAGWAEAGPRSGTAAALGAEAGANSVFSMTTGQLKRRAPSGNKRPRPQRCTPALAGTDAHVAETHMHTPTCRAPRRTHPRAHRLDDILRSMTHEQFVGCAAERHPPACVAVPRGSVVQTVQRRTAADSRPERLVRAHPSG